VREINVMTVIRIIEKMYGKLLKILNKNTVTGPYIFGKSKFVEYPFVLVA